MVDRLVLGCGELCRGIITEIRDWQGDLLVIDPDERAVDHLRDVSVNAEVGDITDPDAIGERGIDPDVIVVLTEYRPRATAAAHAAREAYPGAYLLSLPGETGDYTQIPAVVDGVISPGGLLLDELDERYVEAHPDRLAELRDTLGAMDGTLTICTHDNPDPDALGAALALRAIANRFSVPATICYFGDITHQENRAFVNLLDVDLEALADPAEFEADHLALVDHSRPGVNDQLAPDTPVDIVIDHHPPTELPEASFVDVRSDVGATSTLLVDYLRGYDIDVETEVATGLLYGIRVDTRDFGRETTERDFEAAAWLLPRADLDALVRIESPSLSPTTLETIGKAIRERHVADGVLTTCVGMVQSRDSLAQAADRLLGLEDVHVTVAYGYTEDTVHLSGRARGGAADLGQVFRHAFDDLGSAGGHESMAGAQLPLGIFQALGDERVQPQLSEIIEEQIERRLRAALEDLDANVA
ncbi:MAG: DHH family phosphoesterase [Halobacteriota archaeon]